ncbi:fibronectin type III domain-containing protein, partial [Streptomyces tunisiensis]|uniref:fibronectin type III domain-containing protein n=1 Tax=Streptomyces tunisiensis TaxID=948699 RepID=UPI003EE30417
MRGVTPTASSRRLLALCAVVLLTVSCRWGGQDDTGGERPPGAPTGVTAQAGSATSVHVMWNRAGPAGSKVTGYAVYWDRTRVEQVPASTHMVDVTGLRPATAYVFTVRARDADGRLGPPSREVRATTPAAARADTAPPTAPGDLEGRRGG